MRQVYINTMLTNVGIKFNELLNKKKLIYLFIVSMNLFTFTVMTLKFELKKLKYIYGKTSIMLVLLSNFKAKQ